jgi:DNA (cytosine-5)-methyltransferase 1
MKAFSLFTGIGGFDLALKRNGVELVGACEIDRYARSVYGKHFSGVPIHENATTIEPKEIPDHSIFVAGFPCQAFSIAGQRRGFNDTRGTLFFEIQRIVEEKLPSILLLENVLGLLSHDKGQTFATILDTLDALGYDVEWQVLNSKNYGVAQNRERIFIVGHSRGKRTRKIFPLGGNDEKDIGGQIKLINKLSQCNSAYDTSGLMPALNSGTHGYATGNITISSTQKNRSTMKEVSPTLNCTHEQVMVYTSQTGHNMKQEIQKRDSTWTLGTTSQRDFGLMEGTRLRRLTPLECERLQGFPDNWTAGHSDTQRYKMCGNAVTVPVVEYLVQELVK